MFRTGVICLFLLSALISSKGSSTMGVGFLQQATEATDYRGKRVRYSGDLKTQEAKGWAGLWFRALAMRRNT